MQYTTNSQGCSHNTEQFTNLNNAHSQTLFTKLALSYTATLIYVLLYKWCSKTNNEYR